MEYTLENALSSKDVWLIFDIHHSLIESPPQIKSWRQILNLFLLKFAKKIS